MKHHLPCLAFRKLSYKKSFRESSNQVAMNSLESKKHWFFKKVFTLGSFKNWGPKSNWQRVKQGQLKGL